MTGPKNARTAGSRRTAMIAIAWFVRMRSADRTPEDERRFRAWLEEDASHAAAYADIEGVWDTTRDLETLPGLQ
ncbi:MAG: FecR/PupR family sigma factor regulator, partial [Alphaproteobacteria bacterium]